MPSHTLKFGDRVTHVDDNTLQGTVIGLTTLFAVNEGDCEDDERWDPWYQIEWDHQEFIGQESEESLVKV
jgi:hypothetical protein